MANAEEFDVITRFAREKLREIGREIYDGNVAVNPIKNQENRQLRYCAFQAICRYDSRIPALAKEALTVTIRKMYLIKCVHRLQRQSIKHAMEIII